MNEPFLSPRLTGERFENGSLPFSFLGDLAIMQEMVIEVAKWRFMQSHPDRSRAPKGFGKEITLTLDRIEKGSTRPIVNLLVAGGVLYSSMQEYYHEARDRIIGAIRAANLKQPATAILPKKYLSYFDQLGRSLRDNEAIEFCSDDKNHAAKLTQDTRRRLVHESSSPNEITEEIRIFGAIPEMDQDANTFQLQLTNGAKLPKTYLEELHYDSIFEAFKGYRNGTKIRIDGYATLSSGKEIRKIKSIRHTSVLDSMDVYFRLDEIKANATLWHKDSHVSPSVDFIDWTAHSFSSFFPEDVSLPFIYPTTEGDLRFEWLIGRKDVSMEIDSLSHLGFWHVLDLDSRKSESKEIDLNESSQWAWFAKEILSYGGTRNDS